MTPLRKQISTMMWKEWRDMPFGFRRTRWRQETLPLLMSIGGLAILLPLMAGGAWTNSPLVVLIAMLQAHAITGGVVSDALAGERERYTLETLLATPLSDKAIILGKMLSAWLYGWSVAILLTLLSLATANATEPSSAPMFFSQGIWWSAIALSGAAGLVATGTSALLSMKARSARHVQQLQGVFVFGVFAILLALPWRDQLFGLVGSGNLVGVAALIGTLFFASGATLVALATMRFRRSVLVLSID